MHEAFAQVTLARQAAARHSRGTNGRQFVAKRVARDNLVVHIGHVTVRAPPLRVLGARLMAHVSARGSTSAIGVDVWTVAGQVDADNSFGAKLRLNDECKIRADGDTWRLESLTRLH